MFIQLSLEAIKLIYWDFYRLRTNKYMGLQVRLIKGNILIFKRYQWSTGVIVYWVFVKILHPLSLSDNLTAICSQQIHWRNLIRIFLKHFWNLYCLTNHWVKKNQYSFQFFERNPVEFWILYWFVQMYFIIVL